MKKLVRYDKGEIRSALFTPEGFLKVDAVCTRTGVFNYVNEDGSLRRELRHPDDVLKQDSLKTMEMIPITLLHPDERLVDSENSQRLSKGLTGENVKVDGKYIKNRVLVTSQDAVDAILSGVQELSLGYEVVLVEEDGEYDGERYDYRQTNIIYNHLAIVPSSRAGKEARIILGRGDAAQELEVENVRLDNLELPKKKKTDSKEHSQQTRRDRMKKITLDGIEYEAAPEVINALNKAQAKNDELDGQVKTLTEKVSKIQADHDTLKEENEKLQNNDGAEEIQKAVSARLSLVSEATPHLDEDTVKKVADMNDTDIKKAVIMAHFPKANLDEKDEVYIQARYDAALEVEVKTDKSEENMSSQRQTVNKDGDKGKKTVNADESKKKFHNDLENAWKDED